MEALPSPRTSVDRSSNFGSNVGGAVGVQVREGLVLHKRVPGSALESPQACVPPAQKGVRQLSVWCGLLEGAMLSFMSSSPPGEMKGKASFNLFW